LKKEITISLSCFLLLIALHCNGQSFISTNILWNNNKFKILDYPNIYNIQFEKKYKRRYHKFKIGFARPIDQEVNTPPNGWLGSYRERNKLMMLQHQFAIKNQNPTKGIMVYGINNIYYKIRDKDWDNIPENFSSSDKAIILGTGILLENNFKLAKRLFLSAGVQAQIDWLALGSSYSEYPSLPLEEQKRTVFEFGFGPSLAFTTGLKLLLGEEN